MPSVVMKRNEMMKPKAKRAADDPARLHEPDRPAPHELVHAEEQPADLQVSGDAADDRGEDPGGVRRRNAQTESERPCQSAEELKHRHRRPAQRPVQQIGLPVLAIETQEHERHHRRADGLGDQCDACREVKLRRQKDSPSAEPVDSAVSMEHLPGEHRQSTVE